MNSVEFALTKHPVISEKGLNSIGEEVFSVQYGETGAFRIVKGVIKRIEIISDLYLSIKVHNEVLPNSEYMFFYGSSENEIMFYASKSDARKRKVS